MARLRVRVGLGLGLGLGSGLGLRLGVSWKSIREEDPISETRATPSRVTVGFIIGVMSGSGLPGSGLE